MRISVWCKLHNAPVVASTDDYGPEWFPMGDNTYAFETKGMYCKSDEVVRVEDSDAVACNGSTEDAESCWVIRFHDLLSGELEDHEFFPIEV